MVDIINGSVRVDEVDEVLDNLDDILMSQGTNINAGVKVQLLVDSVTTNLTEVITLI